MGKPARNRYYYHGDNDGDTLLPGMAVSESRIEEGLRVKGYRNHIHLLSLIICLLSFFFFISIFQELFLLGTSADSDALAISK